MNKRIEIVFDKAFGKPVLKGTRIAVELILDLLSNGLSTEDIIQEYPQLTKEDIGACLGYAKNLISEQKIYKAS
jgi:uncharacterized protein (DUF433 family)